MTSATTKAAIAEAEASLLTPQMISVILSLILTALKAAITNEQIDTIITSLQAFLPQIASSGNAIVQDIITAIGELTQKGGLTDAQMAALLAAKTALDTQTDADIAAALAYAGSN